MTFSAAAMRALLEAHAPAAASGLLVAISGGSDSASLLTALAHPGVAPFRALPVRAIHVDHRLQPAAADLRRACEALCGRLHVPLTVVEVRVASARGVSLEAAAREARYDGIAGELHAGECLLTAHHAEDQAESLLLQLLRGAGLKGLSAMPLCRPWRQGWHLRPLLGVARRDLCAYAATAGVAAVADPMNEDLRFDRNYLRAELWPRIEARWPGAAAALARSARHCAQAQEQLEDAASIAVLELRDGATLSVPGLRRLTPAGRQNALRFWLAAGGVEPPSSVRLSEALRQILTAAPDHLPAVVWGDHALRRYRDRLFLTAATPPRLGLPQQWPIAGAAACELGPMLGTLRWAAQPGGLDPERLPPSLSVRRRRGGEVLRPRHGARTQSVQHLCQSLGVLPWMRDALPLIYAGTELVAVADLWQDVRWCVADGAAGIGCEWRGAPAIT